jgi:hypoxanthine phosphoribosyltransferase
VAAVRSDDDGDAVRFAHDSERRFARILDFYNVPWEYEPVEFVLDWDERGRPAAAFRPDFWLPDPGLFVELTTLNQRLVTKKNGKIRRMGLLYPDIRVTVLYQRDTLALLAKYGLAGRARRPDVAQTA